MKRSERLRRSSVQCRPLPIIIDRRVCGFLRPTNSFGSQIAVTISKEVGIAVAGSAALALAGVFGWRAFRQWRRKSPDEIERLRRLYVNACGRIIVGRIVELADPQPGGPSGPVLLYDYEVGGVTYEAAQDLSALPEIAAAAPFLPGQTTNIKYDPKQPTNSILACETWCGVPDLEPNRNKPPILKEPAPNPAVEEIP